jgi:hypothetical protein
MASQSLAEDNEAHDVDVGVKKGHSCGDGISSLVVVMVETT